MEPMTPSAGRLSSARRRTNAATDHVYRTTPSPTVETKPQAREDAIADAEVRRACFLRCEEIRRIVKTATRDEGEWSRTAKAVVTEELLRNVDPHDAEGRTLWVDDPNTVHQVRRRVQRINRELRHMPEEYWSGVARRMYLQLSA